MKFERKRKLPITTLLYALGYKRNQIYSTDIIPEYAQFVHDLYPGINISCTDVGEYSYQNNTIYRLYPRNGPKYIWACP